MNGVASFDDVSRWLDAHQLLWPLKGFDLLGRLHACIDTADTDLKAREYIEAAEGFSKFKRLELTSLGREVGGDVPRWWVFAREPNVQSLWDDTKLAFFAAQALVRAVEKIGREVALDYDQIICDLGEFLKKHCCELEVLLRYANSLHSKNELAPAILFSYAVWGSTKRADRSLEGYSAADIFHRAGELALGIKRRSNATLFWEWFDLVGDEHEDLDAESEAVSTIRLLFLAQVRIRESLLQYFTGLRDSLRHIDTLCQEFFQREYIYADDRFVRLLLRKISGQGSAVETDLWDVTETLEMWSARSQHKEAAAIQFCESVAAFANRRGGVLIVGVTKHNSVVGVVDTENRIKHIEKVLRDHIESQVDFVRVRSVPLEEAGVTKACLIVVVGQTEAPLGVRRIDGSYSYPLRVGPGMDRVSREKIAATKAHLKGTSFSFAAELESWVADVA